MRLNMKNLLKVILLSYFILISFYAGATENFYIEGKVGLSKPRNIKPDLNNPDNTDFVGAKLKNSALYSINVGYNINDRFSLGLSIGYNSSFKYNSLVQDTKDNNFTSTGKIKALTTILNGYYNLLDSSNMIIPYVGAGVGFSRNTLTDRIVFKNDNYFKTMKGASKTNFAWNLIAGGLINTNKNTQVILEYNYMDFGKIKSGTIDVFPNENYPRAMTKTNLRAHSLMIGLRYRF